MRETASGEWFPRWAAFILADLLQVAAAWNAQGISTG
jgi:hypothetical protein